MKPTAKKCHDFVEEITNVILKHLDIMDSAAVATLAMQCLTTIMFNRANSQVDAIVIMETVLLECIKSHLNSEEKYGTGRN